MLEIPELTAQAIRDAAVRIDPVFTGSPQFVHDGLSERLGVPVVVKVETVNPIRSFKGRGTWLAVQGLAGEGRIGPDRPIVVASAGNFGQGVAYAARALGVSAVVFTSRHANRGKVARMRALGATVIAVGEDFDDARGASERYAAERGAELLVDGDDPRIATGAASLALELTDAVDAGVLPRLAVASVPVGNGALINGVGSWLRHASAGTRVVGVQAEGADAMTRSFAAGRPIDGDHVDTYADGIASRIAIPRAVELMFGRVDAMHTVTEDALHEAQAALTEALGITVEGRGGCLVGGAAPVAAARRRRRSSSSPAATPDPSGGGVGPRMAGTRNLPFDVRDLARSVVPIVLLSLGAAVPQARFAVLFVIAAGPRSPSHATRRSAGRGQARYQSPSACSGARSRPVSGPDGSSIARIRHRRSPCGARSKASSSCSRWPRWRSCSAPSRRPSTCGCRPGAGGRGRSWLPRHRPDRAGPRAVPCPAVLRRRVVHDPARRPRAGARLRGVEWRHGGGRLSRRPDGLVRAGDGHRVPRSSVRPWSSGWRTREPTSSASRSR